MARTVDPGPASGRHDAPLPAATHHVPRTPQRRRRRSHTAPVRPLARRQHRRQSGQRHRSGSRRGLQGLARCPTRHQDPDTREEHPAPTAPHDPNLLRAPHRMGLARRTRPQPDPARRHPTAPEPIPKFLTDQQAASFMAAAKAHPLPRYRLVAQVLARTGLRATELCELAADAVPGSATTATGSASPSASSATTA